MSWHYTSYAAVLSVTAVVSAVLAFHGWARRRMPGSLPFSLLMTAVFLWALAGAWEAAVVETSVKIIAAKIEYLGIVSIAPLWFLFALDYTRRDRWLKTKNIALLWIVPAVVVVLAATNELHGLIWNRITPVSTESGALLIYSHGIGVWCNAAYSYALLFMGTFVLLKTIFQSSPVIRMQAGLLVIAALIPWLSNFVYLTNLVRIAGIDLTPVAFTITGLFVALSIFRYRLFDVVPVAHFALFKSMGDGAIVLDAQNRFVEINPAAREMTLIPESMLGHPVEDVFRTWPDLAGRFLEIVQSDGATIVPCPGGERWMDVRVTTLTNRRGKASGRLIIMRDITALKRSEQEQAALLDRIRRRETRLRFITDNMVDSIVQIDAETIIQFVSPSVKRVFGYEISDVLGRPVAAFTHPDDLPRVQKEYRAAVGSKAPSVRLEYRARKADGSYFWLESEAHIIYGADGVYAGSIFGSRDMSKRKAAEEALLASLREKDVLLKEVHHRVRNNMQVISSLLNHQARQVSDPAVIEMFRDSQSRIRSIAMVHEKLYRSTDLSRIDFSDYIQSLAVHLFHSLQVHPTQVRPRLDLEKIELDINTAIPLGLMVNELITNALKHAFPDGRKGEVLVAFKHAGPDRLRLTIKDDGVGVSNVREFQKSESLGLQIVRMLVDQVEGVLEVDAAAPGTEIRVTFPAPSLDPRP